MRFAINVPNFAAFGEARALARLAQEAEAAGWDGFFIWDHLAHDWDQTTADPWIALAAMASVTERIRIGPMVTPLPRRRPWKLARETATLDQLSGGRLILGVGIGSDWVREYSAFGEPVGDALHGAMLDEGLEVLTGLWTGEPFSYTGTHYTARDARFLPTPAQTPRIPIWVAGYWPHKRPFRRAARWDGVVPLRADEQPTTPDDVRAMLAYIREQQTDLRPFDVTIYGYTGHMEPPAAANLLREHAAAGVTWWQESFWPNDTLAEASARIRQGPPTL